MAALRLPVSLESARIVSLPESVFYIPNFISSSEEQALLDKVYAAPKPRWKVLSHRRLQIWPSDLSRSDTLIEEPLPAWLTEPIVSRLRDLPVSSNAPEHVFSSSPHGYPNLVLINEYLPGQGIMPHKDGPAYYPVVCTVSLGGSTCLQYYKSKDDGALQPEPMWKLLLEPRSLLITADKLYTDFLHGIADATEDVCLDENTIANWSHLQSPAMVSSGTVQRQTRVSLTYRDVLRTSKIGAKLGLLRSRRA